MNANQWRIVGAGLFCLFIFLSGFWLTRSGKPYNGALINVHKLLALAAVVLFIVTLFRVNRVDVLGAGEWIAGATSVLLFIGLFVTGALVSIDNPMPAIVRRLHHVIPYLAALSTAVTLYLLSRKW
jgi:hypothetical protein